MDIKSRLSKLESAKLPEPERKTWIIVNGEPEPEGIGHEDTLIICPDEATRQLTQRIIAGERTDGG